MEERETEEIIENSKVKIKISIADKWKEIMTKLKDKTGIDGIYIIIFLLLCVLLVYLGIFGTLITNFVGTLYPGFSTIKSIEKKKRKKEWLIYWVIYGCFIIVDMFSAIIMKFIPFYFVLKILFLIWMFLPGSNGSILIYNFLILKLFKSIENIVDFFFKETKDISKQLIEETKNKGFEKMKQISKGFKTFKGFKEFGRGKKDYMSEALKEAQELEKEKNENNPLYGKEFYTALIFPKGDNKINEELKRLNERKKKDEKKGNKNINNINEKIIKEKKNVIVNNIILNNIDNNIIQNEDEYIEFSDEVKEEGNNIKKNNEKKEQVSKEEISNIKLENKDNNE